MLLGVRPAIRREKQGFMKEHGIVREAKSRVYEHQMEMQKIAFLLQK